MGIHLDIDGWVDFGDREGGRWVVAQVGDTLQIRSRRATVLTV